MKFWCIEWYLTENIDTAKYLTVHSSINQYLVDTILENNLYRFLTNALHFGIFIILLSIVLDMSERITNNNFVDQKQKNKEPLTSDNIN